MEEKNLSGFRWGETLVKNRTVTVGRTLVLKICRFSKVKQKKVFFYRVKKGKQREAKSLRGCWTSQRK